METPNTETNKALRELHILRAKIERLDKEIRKNHLTTTPEVVTVAARMNDLIDGLTVTVSE